MARAQQLGTITSLDGLRELAAEGVIYVRYSRGHRDDIRRGYSLNHQTRTREPGLSAQAIRPDDWQSGPGWVARLLADYAARLLYDADSYGWVCRARQVGTDADGCPAITDIITLAILDTELVRRCIAYSRAVYERDRTHRGVNDTRPWPAITDYLSEGDER